MMSSPSTRGRIGREGHELQQWLTGPALPKKRFSETTQEGWGIGRGNDANPFRRMFSAPSDSERYHTFTCRIAPARIQTSMRGDRIRPQVLNLLMMQNGKRYTEGPQQQESQGIPSSV